MCLKATEFEVARLLDIPLIAPHFSVIESELILIIGKDEIDIGSGCVSSGAFQRNSLPGSNYQSRIP
jgi:hypothetical protein